MIDIVDHMGKSLTNVDDIDGASNDIGNDMNAPERHAQRHDIVENDVDNDIVTPNIDIDDDMDHVVVDIDMSSIDMVDDL